MENKYKAHKWVKKVIVSCATHTHFMVCKKLVENFSLLYKDRELTSTLDHEINKLRRSGHLIGQRYTWENDRPLKPVKKKECICDVIKREGGSGRCCIHNINWV